MPFFIIIIIIILLFSTKQNVHSVKKSTHENLRRTTNVQKA